LAAGSEKADADVSSELEAGATRAASRGAPDTAAGLYAAAAKLTPSGAPDDRARRLIGEAAAWNAVGDFASATTLAEDALALADAVGQALVQAGEAWARERGLTILGLDVWSTNEPALAFYERTGYRPESLSLIKRIA